MDLESLQGMFGDPEALLGDLLTPESRRTSDQLTALAVVVDAYADHIATTVGAKLVGAHAQLAEAWYRRRTERGKGEEAAGALFGLDLDQAQVDRGRAFVAGVVERAGEDGLGRLWNPATQSPDAGRGGRARACGSSGSTSRELDSPDRRLTGPAPTAGGAGSGPTVQAVASGRRASAGGAAGALGRLLLGKPEVPLDQDVLPLGVTDDPLPVAPVLGVVRGQQHQPGVRPPAELLDEGRVAEVRAHFPVGCHRAEVDDPHVAHRRLRLGILLAEGRIVGDRGHGSGSSWDGSSPILLPCRRPTVAAVRVPPVTPGPAPCGTNIRRPSSQIRIR